MQQNKYTLEDIVNKGELRCYWRVAVVIHCISNVALAINSKRNGGLEYLFSYSRVDN